MTQTQPDYAKVATDLYAACLTATEIPDDALVNEVIAAINDDDLFGDKSAALQMLSTAVENLMGERQRSAMLHRLKVSAIVAAPAGLPPDMPRGSLHSGLRAIREAADRLGSSATVAVADSALPHLWQATALTTVAATEPSVEVVIRTTTPAPPEPDYIAAQLRTSAELSLGEYIRACGITAITSDKIFFAPTIPARKLQGAGASLAGRVLQQDIVVVVDDTLFGGAKEGVFITDQALFVKEAFTPLAMHPLENIRSIRAENNVLYINGERAVGFNMPDKRETGYLFREVSNWLEAGMRRAAANGAPTRPEWLDAGAVDAICRTCQTPELRVAGETIAAGMTADRPERVPARTPCYYVGDDIRDTVVRLLRFGFAMAADEAIVTFSDMATGDQPNPNKAFVVTTAGLRSRCIDSQPAIFVSWEELARLEVVTEFTESIYTGVALSDGRRIHIGGLNAVVRPFGGRLVGELIDYARSRTGARGGPRDDTRRAEPGAKPGSARNGTAAETDTEHLLGLLGDDLFEDEAEVAYEKADNEPDSLNSLFADMFLLVASFPDFCEQNGIALSRLGHRLVRCDAIQFEVSAYLNALVAFLAASRHGLPDQKAGMFGGVLRVAVVMPYMMKVESWKEQVKAGRVKDFSAAERDSKLMDIYTGKYTHYLGLFFMADANRAETHESRMMLLHQFRCQLLNPSVFDTLPETDVRLLHEQCSRLFSEDIALEFMQDVSIKMEKALAAFFERVNDE